MQRLPTELINIILNDLDWKTILNVLEMSDNLMDIIIPILNKKLKITINASSFKEIKRECETRHIIVSLNKLGHRYHSHYGFNWNQRTDVLRSHEFFDEIIEYAIENNHYIIDDQGKRITFTSDITDNNVLINYDNINDEVDFSLSYEKVIIRHRIYFEICPKEWYNSKARNFCNRDGLPFLNSKSYIKIINPFIEVEMSAVEKGSPITIDDILFATRALCRDETRTYENFKIIDENEKILILQPKINNWAMS